MFGSSNSSHSPEGSIHFETTAHCSLNLLPLVLLFDLLKFSPFTTHSTPQCFSPSSFNSSNFCHLNKLLFVLPNPLHSCSTLQTKYTTHSNTFHFLTHRQVSVVSTFVHFHSLSIFFQQPRRFAGTLINPLHSNLLSHRQPFNAALTLP